MLGSKFIDVVLILCMAYFAVTQLSKGQIGFGIFFAVLCVVNILTLVMKVKREKEENSVQ